MVISVVKIGSSWWSLGYLKRGQFKVVVSVFKKGQFWRLLVL